MQGLENLLRLEICACQNGNPVYTKEPRVAQFRDKWHPSVISKLMHDSVYKRNICIYLYSLIISIPLIPYSQMKALDFGLTSVAEELQHVANQTINSDQSIDDTRGFQEEDCITALDKHVKKALKDIDKTEARIKSVAKNVTNFRHQLIKEFMSTYMVNKKRYCPGCKAPSREVKSEHNSRVFLKGLSAKDAVKWVKIQVTESHIARQTNDGPSNEPGINKVQNFSLISMNHF